MIKIVYFEIGRLANINQLLPDVQSVTNKLSLLTQYKQDYQRELEKLKDLSGKQYTEVHNKIVYEFPQK